MQYRVKVRKVGNVVTSLLADVGISLCVQLHEAAVARCAHAAAHADRYTI